MKRIPLSRRRFVVAVLALAGAAAVPGHALLLAGRAWADSTPGEDARTALIRVARLLYPHRALDDAVYAEVLDQAMAAIADDALFQQLLADAEAALDADSGGSFLHAAPETQLEALEAIQWEPYFLPIQLTFANRLYSHPRAWAMMGYEGPSWQQGGWLDRGAGDIDWLPEDAS